MIYGKAIVALLGCLLIGCSRDSDLSEEGAVEAPVRQVSPEKDEAFNKKLKVQDRVRRGIMLKYAELKREYDSISTNELNGARAKELKGQLDQLAAEFEANRLKTTNMVRERYRAQAMEK